MRAQYNDNIPDDETFLENETDEEIDTVTTDLVQAVSTIIENLQHTPKKEQQLDNWWLKAAQTLLLTHYMQSNSFPSAEKDQLLDFLVFLQTDLGDDDCLVLAGSLARLTEIRPIDMATTFTFDASLPLTAILATILLQTALYGSSLWMQRCLYTYAMANTDDEVMQTMYLKSAGEDWTTNQQMTFFKLCNEALPNEYHKKMLQMIQTYCVKSGFVMQALEKSPQTALSVVETEIRNELPRRVHDIGINIKRVEPNHFNMKSILWVTKRVFSRLPALSVATNYEITLQKNLARSKIVFKNIRNYLTDDLAMAEVIITLCCACLKFKGWYPRRPQIMALLILINFDQLDFNLLLEAITGEGKSLIVVLFTVILAHQNKHIDVVTSSPILAVRDVEEWEEFFQYFGVTVGHNTSLNRYENADMNEVLTDCYKKQVVYGTVGNFAGDILRQEFEQNNIRQGRRFDVVIVDEVDMLMLDEGVQFTYLSHKAAILKHMEPVVAAVWGMVGPLNLCRTTDGEILYAGSPNLFTQAIYECLDPEISLVQSHEHILLIAKDLGIFTENQYATLLQDDQEAKKTTIAEFTIDQTLALISGLADYENMPEFKAYTIDSVGALEAVTAVEYEDSAEKLLMLGNGLACILNTRYEIIDRGTEIVKTKLNFSDKESDAVIRVPKHLQDFAISQLPAYVENALRALHMEEDREYAITKGNIIPVDFQNSGVMELNKTWGGGLQQMLEMKHGLSMTPISLVTNFMSNVEFFSRYKGIYGMSGTLGLDEQSNATTILHELYKVDVGSIGTFKVRKLVEEPALIVESYEKWFKTIVDIVRKESQEVASWKKGRASLILCEDIRTAEYLKAYFVDTEDWPEDKVYLYAHSNSEQLSSIDKMFGPGEIIIATNLAGRGTNIKVTDEVNASGGLLCLMTFLARNRRVELQAFGRTARGGQPGSVRCILNYATMPAKYYGMNIEEIRSMRAEDESIRLRELLDSDVKEVQLKEKLFKEYCHFLQNVYKKSDGRDDQTVIINAYNEMWAQWLMMRSNKVEMLLEKDLTSELQGKLNGDWIPKFSVHRIFPSTFVAANFYHYIQFGNQILTSADEDEDTRWAIPHYSMSIQLEPQYSTIAYYNRAYAMIVSEISDNKKNARADIEAAIAGLDLYLGEVSTVTQCVATVGQTKVFERREANDFGDGELKADMNSQVLARFEILHFVREKMQEAIQKIDSISGDIIAKPVGIFALLPEADHTISLELARMWELGLEIVYTIEKKPRFVWEALIVFLLGVAQIVAGVLLTVFTAGAAAQFGMGLIGEGISDCIDGIEGMITGEFSWAEWGISKATSIALSLVTGGLSRLASTGLKAIKHGFKAAKRAGKTLKSIPKMVGSTTKSAAKANLKTASKYVAKESVMQGVSYGTSKILNLAVNEVTKLIGEKLKESFLRIIRTSFTSGYLGQVVDGRFIAELNTYYKDKANVPASMLSSGKKIFSNVGESVTSKLNNNSEIKERITTTSLDLFAELSQKSKKLKGIANFAQSAIVLTIVTDTVASLGFLVDEFPTKMEDVSREFIEDQKIIMSGKSADPYRGYSCANKLKNDLADHAGDVFANAVEVLLQGKLRPLVGTGSMSHRFNRLTHKVVGNYVLKTDKTIEDIKSIQHANYIRAVGFDTGSGRASNIALVKVYTKKMASSDTPGSLMELRVAAEHYGQKVTIYTEKNGKLIKDTVINPSNKKTQDEIKLVYIPPPNPNSVGHYDVLISGVRKRVEADQSNCLFHAYAFSRKSDLTRSQLKQEALWLRQTVVDDIANNPGKFAEHIKLRVQMDNLRRGNRFALIGAGPRDEGTKILDGFYKQEAKGDKIFTMYEQANGVKCKAWRRYNKNLTVDANGDVQESDARLQDFEVEMEGLNLATAAGKRCWDTKPVVGMIKRGPGADARDSEVSYHLCPSRGGANAGDQYANAIPASAHYNNLEKYIWTKPMKQMLGSKNFSMTVKGLCGGLDERMYDGKRDIDAPTKDLLSKRYALIEKKEPRAYRLLSGSSFIIKIPPGVTLTATDINDISEATFKSDDDIGTDTNLADGTISIIMPTDSELFIPNDLTRLQPNGELYAGELVHARMKQPKLKVHRSVPYRVRAPAPTPAKTPQDKLDFARDFALFIA